jgi:hypothetical protein
MSPIDTRRSLYKNIVLSGGSTMFKDFHRRVQVRSSRVCDRACGVRETVYSVRVRACDGSVCVRGSWAGAGRVQRDIKRRVDTRVAASEALSGNGMKAAEVRFCAQAALLGRESGRVGERASAPSWPTRAQQAPPCVGSTARYALTSLTSLTNRWR